MAVVCNYLKLCNLDMFEKLQKQHSAPISYIILDNREQ